MCCGPQIWINEGVASARSLGDQIALRKLNKATHEACVECSPASRVEDEQLPVNLWNEPWTPGRQPACRSAATGIIIISPGISVITVIITIIPALAPSSLTKPSCCHNNSLLSGPRSAQCQLGRTNPPPPVKP